MADVYKFKVKLKNAENIIWRDIEITSVSNVAKLGYAVLGVFETTGSHLFNIKYNGRRYEIIFEEDNYDSEPAIDPIKTKLSSLKLDVGNTLTMQYDYGAGWEFSIELVSITEMKPRSGTHYPYVTDGKGKGIIEDISPCELLEIIKDTNKTGKFPKVPDMITGVELDWDYKKFDLEYCNTFLKDKIRYMKDAYENYE